MQEKDPKKLARLILVIGVIIIAVLLAVIVWQLVVIQNLKSELSISTNMQTISANLMQIVRCLCL